MFSLRRCCIGAALGLSLLACQPAQAVPFPIQNPSFNTSKGVVTGWNAGWSFLGSAARWNNFANGFLGQTKSVTLNTTQTYTLSFHYLAKGYGPFSFEFGNSRGVSYRRVLDVSSSTKSGSYRVQITHPRSVGALGFFAQNTFLQISHLNAVPAPAPAAAPEVDGQTAAAPLALALGGLALMTERRRRAQVIGGEAAD